MIIFVVSLRFIEDMNIINNNKRREVLIVILPNTNLNEPTILYCLPHIYK